MWSTAGYASALRRICRRTTWSAKSFGSGSTAGALLRSHPRAGCCFLFAAPPDGGGEGVALRAVVVVSSALHAVNARRGGGAMELPARSSAECQGGVRSLAGPGSRGDRAEAAKACIRILLAQGTSRLASISLRSPVARPRGSGGVWRRSRKLADREGCRRRHPEETAERGGARRLVEERRRPSVKE